MTAVYFDLETGGVEPHRPDIQLAAIAVDESTGAELETFERKIAFDPAKADPKALELNHYSAELWADAPTEAVVTRSFERFLERHRCIEAVSRAGKPYRLAKLVGHNAATFDGPRLRAMFQRHDRFLPADPRVRCTLQRAMWFFDEAGGPPPRDFKLATLCRHFGIPVDGAHEALTDVRLTIALARAIARAGVVQDTEVR